MENKIIVITSRFGSLSEFFDLWLKSASRNKDVDFLILTDIDIKCNADNIMVEKYSSFEQFINEVNEKIGYNTGIVTPFKTADLRPAYAFLFEDIIKQKYYERYGNKGKYDFWGYCDTDLIFGDLSHFISDDTLDNCDVFQTWGHFTLVRNIDKFNQLYGACYKQYKLKKSLKLPENCMVEEGPFILQLHAAGARIDSDVRRIADIKRNVFEFTVDGQNYKGQRFIYQSGKIIRIIENEGQICVVDEFMYMHFMKRMMENIPKCHMDLLLNENGIMPLNEKTIFNDFYSEYAHNVWEKFTRVSEDIRYKKVNWWYRITHINNWIYRRKTREIEIEKRRLIRKYYGL